MALSDGKRLWLDGGLAVAWAGVIWALGGGDFSAPETSRILGPLIEWLFPDWSAEQRVLWLGAIRKLAHPVEYGVFAVLVLRFVDARQRLRFGRSPVVLSLVTSLAVSALLALLDESRQSTLASRTGSGFDVALDVFGAAAALTVAVTVASFVGGRPFGVPGWSEAASPTPPAPPSDPTAA